MIALWFVLNFLEQIRNKKLNCSKFRSLAQTCVYPLKRTDSNAVIETDEKSHLRAIDKVSAGTEQYRLRGIAVLVFFMRTIHQEFVLKPSPTKFPLNLHHSEPIKSFIT